MQNDGESRQSLLALVEHVETQLRFGSRLELVCSVAGSDRDGQGVTSGLGHELFYFLRLCVGGILLRHVYIVLDASQSAQLSLYDYTVLMRILDHLAGDLDVLLERFGGSVDHDRSKSTVDAGLAGLKIRTVIQVQCDRNIRALLHRCLYQLDQVGVVGIGTGTLGYLQDQRCALLLCCLGDTLYDLHIVDVECSDRITAIIRFLEHFGCGY